RRWPPGARGACSTEVARTRRGRGSPRSAIRSRPPSKLLRERDADPEPRPGDPSRPCGHPVDQFEDPPAGRRDVVRLAGSAGTVVAGTLVGGGALPVPVGP